MIPMAPADVDQPAAACLMVRRPRSTRSAAWTSASIPAWFEDVDFCRRLRATGCRIRFEPRASFVHQGGVAMRTLGLGRFSSIWYANMERYVRQHHGTAGWLLLKEVDCRRHERADCNFVAAGSRRSARAYAACSRPPPWRRAAVPSTRFAA